MLVIPVAPADTASAMPGAVDQLVCCETPALRYAIRLDDDDFPQLTDRAVIDISATAMDAEIPVGTTNKTLENGRSGHAG